MSGLHDAASAVGDDPTFADPAPADLDALVGRLRRLGVLPDDGPPGLGVEVLSGGVSNDVLALTAPGIDVVVKRALPQLRVTEEWLASPERVVTEAKALRLAGRLQPGTVPPVVALDPAHHVGVIGRAPRGHREWRGELLAGTVDLRIPMMLGNILAGWHLATAADPDALADFHDLETFRQLRVDPFYRWVGTRHPDLAGRISSLGDRLLETHRCLVHGDFSPKNVLVGDSGLWVIDWEVAHVGDPVFDLAFLLTHLVCKALHRPGDAAVLQRAADIFLVCYAGKTAEDFGDVDESYLVEQVACLLLARVDGKSPAAYLGENERIHARLLARGLLASSAPSLTDLWRHVL
ncbi:MULTISPECIES: phosphotransferase family protein [unclassified Streptomyces]|uniref:phosphotransferase family protein n=1 Tax=unclassified Streptomyces TaxID=2593676 RepID=UPI0022524A2F|nr:MULTISPECIES: phosphotransferase [unclassified Streptomyces]MCX4406048.1 phosphotransferase [Streptomyces sp. NBC_01764]MCX5189428.1 phosphotransferase [Streptomyces sp. NBC_00268]